MPGQFVAAFVGVLAFILGFDAFRQYRTATKASSWPRVQGRILSATLEDGPSSGRLMPVATHRVAIKYTYEVGGREWTSQRVFFGDQSFEKGDGARDRVRRYEPDSAVDVFYNPDDPAQAVLEPATAWQKAAIQGVASVGLILLSIAAVVLASRR